MGGVHLDIRVQPGARTESVGGTYDGALVVRVCQAPQGGLATAAALRALARALGVRAHHVRLVSGRVSRHKIVEIAADARDHESIARRIDQLRRTTRGGSADHARPTELP